MSVGCSPGWEVKEEFNRNPPQVSIVRNIQVLPVKEVERKKGGERSCPMLSRPRLGLLVLKRLSKRKEWVTDSKVFQAGNDGENVFFRRGRLEVSWGQGKAQGRRTAS